MNTTAEDVLVQPLFLAFFFGDRTDMLSRHLLLFVLLMSPVCSAAWAQPASSPAAASPGQPELLTVAGHGIAGRYYAPQGDREGAAVLMLGGSDCGYPSANAARDLAASGHAVLALAYCSGFSGRIDGLPEGLARIPLEYVDRGFNWLSGRAGRKRAIAVMGESRGAELALLFGSVRRDVRAVIAFSPSSLVWAAVGDSSGTIPAWTREGRAVPHVTHKMELAPGPGPFVTALADPRQVRNASIAVESIRGPVLLVSSRSDAIWPAARMANSLEERLRRAHFEFPSENLQFDEASHLLMGPGPGMVEYRQGNFKISFGGTAEGTLSARNAGWSAAKHLLASIPVDSALGNRQGTENLPAWEFAGKKVCLDVESICIEASVVLERNLVPVTARDPDGSSSKWSIKFGSFADPWRWSEREEFEDRTNIFEYSVSPSDLSPPTVYEFEGGIRVKLTCRTGTCIQVSGVRAGQPHSEGRRENFWPVANVSSAREVVQALTQVLKGKKR